MTRLMGAAFIIIGVNSCAGAAAIYVSPVGDDHWTGGLAAPNRQKTDGPLATLPAALEAAQKLRRLANTTNPDIKILLRGGVYELTAPIVLKPADSGSDTNRPLIIAAYKHEKPVFSGGQKITGWTPVTNVAGIWVVRVPDGWNFRQLFVNGRRAQRARTPNHGLFRIDGPSPQSKPARFTYHPGDIKKQWAADGDVEVVALLAWSEFRMKIRDVDEAKHEVTLSTDPAPSNQEANAGYYIENAPDALDEPGEWHLNSHTGIITYWPKPGEDMKRADVIGSRATELLRFEGDIIGRHPVANVVLDGLTFAHSDWHLDKDGYAGVQAAVQVPGTVHGEGVVDCIIRNCRFEHLGGYALEFGRACQRLKITGNEIVDIGAGGLRLGEGTSRAEPFDLCSGNIITDNHIHELGRVYPSAVGILVLISGGNLIAHNEINDLFYTAISVGWVWGYQESACHDNRIEFNHLHDIGRGLLSDMGGIYTLGIQKGTVERNNLIHDVSCSVYGGWGVYPDEGSSDILIESNVVYRTSSASFHQHYGRENIIRNNVFALGRDHQLMRTRAEPHISFRFDHNIVYFNSGDLLGSNWGDDKFEMDYNIYFDARPGATPAAMRFAGGDFSAWQKRGHDIHSRITDPKFDGSGKFPFLPRPYSPALEMGFQPIDLNSVGVRPEQLHASNYDK